MSWFRLKYGLRIDLRVWLRRNARDSRIDFGVSLLLNLSVLNVREVCFSDDFRHLLFYFLDDSCDDFRIGGVDSCHLVEYFLKVLQIYLAQDLIPVLMPVVVLLLLSTFTPFHFFLHRTVQLLQHSLLENLQKSVRYIDDASRYLFQVKRVEVIMSEEL